MEVFIAFFFSITKQTRELPAMLTLIITARNRAYTKELVEIAIRYLKSFSKWRYLSGELSNIIQPYCMQKEYNSYLQDSL